MTLQEARNKLERQKGKKLELERLIAKTRVEIRDKRKHLKNLEQVREIIRVVGISTQQQLQFHISDIASLAMESIFPEPYKLLLKFVERRNKTECDIVFERNEEEFFPMDASGGGTVDVASFALRIASWSMSLHKTRNTIILDEPLRFLSAEYQENASEMIKEISKKLGIQFIIVTHESALALNADKTFEVKIRNGVSKVKTV